MYSGALLSALANTKRDWNVIGFDINSLNTLLTSRYTIPISTELYEERTRLRQTRNCQHCLTKDFKTVLDEDGNKTKEYFEIQTPILESDINIISEVNGLLTEIITKQKETKKWICKKCLNVNFVENTPLSSRKWGSNATFGVVWNQPIECFTNRSNFDKLGMFWITAFQREVDMGLMAFQRAYFDDHGHGMSEDISPFGHDGNKK